MSKKKTAHISTISSSQRLKLAPAAMMAAMLILLTPALPFFPLSSARAQESAACDPNYMESLKARAWLEAEREIIQNQNLISKPDSVLEYSCFKSYVNHTALYVGSLFSETNNMNSLGDSSLDEALTGAVGFSLQSYLMNNFNHFFNRDLNYLDEDVTEDYYVIQGDNYVCDHMGRVWQTARCWNFMNSGYETFDGFFSADLYANTSDPRQIPSEYSCQGPGPQSWGQSIQDARNDNEIYPSRSITGSEYGRIGPFLDPESCAPPVPTGVTVIVSPGELSQGENFYLDGICTNPGCHYVKSGGGSCVQN